VLNVTCIKRRLPPRKANYGKVIPKNKNKIMISVNISFMLGIMKKCQSRGRTIVKEGIN
jgi:hypothetical protein